MIVDPSNRDPACSCNVRKPLNRRKLIFAGISIEVCAANSGDHSRG